MHPAEVGVAPLLRDAEPVGRVRHARRLLVGDAHDLGVRVLVDQPEQVPHVHMVEVDARELPRLHVVALAPPRAYWQECSRIHIRSANY
jgi:hypothetical protein